MELTDNILWLLKQAFHFSLKTVNDAISNHGVTTAQIGLMRQLATNPACPGPSWPAGCSSLRRASSWRSPRWSNAASWSASKTPNMDGSCRPISPIKVAR